MKILIVGGNNAWAIERIYTNYLKELGAEVILYLAPDIIFEYHSKNILNKVLFKTKIWTGYKKVNQGLIKKAQKINPDFILVFKGMEIYPSTWRQLGKQFKLANYNPDHPFIIDSRGSGNRNVSRSVGYFHLHFCYSHSLQARISKDYQIPTVFLPFGYELPVVDFLMAVAEPEIKKACFIGNPDKKRIEIIRSIAKNGIDVDVYGHGWNQTGLKDQKNITIRDAIYGLEFWKRLRQYRVQLNIFRNHNQGSHNMRSFEIPAVGGIELTPFSEEQADFFTSGKEIFFYRNEAEMLEQLRELINLSDARIDMYRSSARSRSLMPGYSYKDRARTVFETFQKMILHD